jgi:hypothetical protein
MAVFEYPGENPVPMFDDFDAEVPQQYERPIEVRRNVQAVVRSVVVWVGGGHDASLGVVVTGSLPTGLKHGYRATAAQWGTGRQRRGKPSLLVYRVSAPKDVLRLSPSTNPYFCVVNQ